MTTTTRARRRPRVRAAAAVSAVALIAAIVASCAPPSGLPDARQFNVPNCSFEVRVTQANGRVGVEARQDGALPPFVADPTRECGAYLAIELVLGADGSGVWYCDPEGSGGSPASVDGQCYSYPAGIVGGTWYGASALQPLQKAYVYWTDEYDATTRIQVYP